MRNAEHIAHPFFAGPTRLRIYRSVIGQSVPGVKLAVRREWVAFGLRRILPKSCSCSVCNSMVAAICSDLLKTSAFETLEIKDDFTPIMVRKHRFWNPLSLRSCETVKQIELNPYSNLDSTRA